MSKDVSSQIQNNWALLTKDVILKDISHILIQKRVMSPSEWEELKGKDCGEAVRMEEFLFKLTRSSEKVRGQFLLALKGGPYDHVYEEINRGTHSLADSCAISKLQREVTKLMQQTSLNRDHNVVRDKEMKYLKGKVEEMETLNAKMKRLESDVNTLNNQLRKKRKEIWNLEKENEIVKDENEKLKNQVEILSRQGTMSSLNTCRQSDLDMEPSTSEQHYLPIEKVTMDTDSWENDQVEGRCQMNSARTKEGRSRSFDMSQLSLLQSDSETEPVKMKQEVEETKKKKKSMSEQHDSETEPMQMEKKGEETKKKKKSMDGVEKPLSVRTIRERKMSRIRREQLDLVTKLGEREKEVEELKKKQESLDNVKKNSGICVIL